MYHFLETCKSLLRRVYSVFMEFLGLIVGRTRPDQRQRPFDVGVTTVHLGKHSEKCIRRFSSCYEALWPPLPWEGSELPFKIFFTMINFASLLTDIQGVKPILPPQGIIWQRGAWCSLDIGYSWSKISSLEVFILYFLYFIFTTLKGVCIKLYLILTQQTLLKMVTSNGHYMRLFENDLRLQMW